jgi:hypothetical protein
MLPPSNGSGNRVARTPLNQCTPIPASDHPRGELPAAEEQLLQELAGRQGRPGLRSVAAARSGEPYPRVEQYVDQIHDQVGHHHEHCGHDHEADDHRQVVLYYGRD